MSENQGAYQVVPDQEQQPYPSKPAETDQNVGQGIPIPAGGIQTHTNSVASMQPPQVIIMNANTQNLRKCDFRDCYFATFSRCDFRWCCKQGCGKSFCLDHKAHMIRIGKNQDYSTAVCKTCEGPFWRAVWITKAIRVGIAFLFLIVCFTFAIISPN